MGFPLISLALHHGSHYRSIFCWSTSTLYGFRISIPSAGSPNTALFSPWMEGNANTDIDDGGAHCPIRARVVQHTVLSAAVGRSVRGQSLRDDLFALVTTNKSF